MGANATVRDGDRARPPQPDQVPRRPALQDGARRQLQGPVLAHQGSRVHGPVRRHAGHGQERWRSRSATTASRRSSSRLCMRPRGRSPTGARAGTPAGCRAPFFTSGRTGASVMDSTPKNGTALPAELAPPTSADDFRRALYWNFDAGGGLIIRCQHRSFRDLSMVGAIPTPIVGIVQRAYNRRGDVSPHARGHRRGTASDLAVRTPLCRSRGGRAAHRARPHRRSRGARRVGTAALAGDRSHGRRDGPAFAEGSARSRHLFCRPGARS